MRVTFVIPSLPVGGSERSLVKTIFAIKGLVTRIDVIVFAKVGAALLQELPAGTHLHALGMSESANPLLWLRVRNLLVRIDPQIVIAWSTYANLVTIIATRFLNISRIIVSERCYVPQIFATEQIGRFRRKLLLLLIKFLYKKAHLVTANSIDNVRFLSKYVGEGPVYAHLPNTIDIDQVDRLAMMQPESAPNEADGPHILALGRLHYQKGFDILLEAFSFIRREHAWNLTIVGDGPERERLQTLASNLGIQRSVQWIGAVVNPFPYYQWADLVLIPSRFEGFPNVALEAMSCGRTVICSDCQTGPRELTEDGLYGVLLEVTDSHFLARAISQIGQDSNLRNVLGRMARQHVLKYYDVRVTKPIFASILLNEKVATEDRDKHRYAAHAVS